MLAVKLPLRLIVLVGLFLVSPVVRAQEAAPAEWEAMYYRYLEFPSYVKGGSIEPHWMADGSSFWYAEGAPANTIIWKVDPKANTKTPLFDTARLRQALTEVLGHKAPYKALPFSEFAFVDGEKAVKFTVEDKEFILQLNTYTITRAPTLSEEEKGRLVPQVVRKAPSPGWGDVLEVLSPDGRSFAGIRDHNLWLRSTHDGRYAQITADGIEDYEWHEGYPSMPPKWSPDSMKVAVKKMDFRDTPRIPIVHYLGRMEEVDWVYYPKAGERRAQSELFIVDILSKRQVRLDSGEEPAQYPLGWRPDSSAFLFLRVARYGKKLELVAADAATGSTRVVLTETAKTYVSFPFRQPEKMLTFLRDGKRFIWLAERDGWDHLHLYDLDGTLICPLTEGLFPVVRVVGVDEQNGWVYFIAQGDARRPYDTHLYRVTLEGKSFERLTDGPGQHEIQLAPSKQFFLDTHSTMARPPVVELRRADGALLQTVSAADIKTLVSELKWSPPEEFVVKAADGKTDIYGVLYKPYDFDPSKKYAVIQLVYNALGFSLLPRSFAEPIGIFRQAEAQWGFVVIIVDGRGTGGRGKTFRDLIYGQIGRYEIADQVAALKQLAEKRPYIDLNRVGVFGSSYGGFMAIRAMLFAPDVYRVGVAISPITDMSAHWRNEVYLGHPQDNREGYEYASNTPFASNLKGKLLLIHGTSDRDVPFSSTVKMVDALIREGKPFDLLVLAEQAHALTGTSARYVWHHAVRRYFQEHLKP